MILPLLRNIKIMSRRETLYCSSTLAIKGMHAKEKMDHISFLREKDIITSTSPSNLMIWLWTLPISSIQCRAWQIR